MTIRSLIATAVTALLLVAPDVGHAEPDLVLVIAVDQLRRDRLDASLPGGLGRLAREGRVFTEGVLDHALTETCPGHASMLTGRHPGPIGVPGNRFVDREQSRAVYCVNDAADDARVLDLAANGEPGTSGRSPRLMQATTLGDWLKERHAGTKVYAVSPKDRAAITMGGQHADAAYFVPTDGPTGFSTSAYYRAALPDWVRAWNANALERVPAQWDHSVVDGTRPDDYHAESDEFSRTSGHPLRGEDPAKTARAIYGTPYLDTLTLDFARALVENEQLGSGEQPDLLAISLSATDIVGHLYGPESHESIDALRRTDAALGEFLDFLDARYGPGRVVVALTSDHGVLPIPEWLAENGRSDCPVDGGRVGVKRLFVGLALSMWWNHGSFFSWPLKPWVSFAGSSVTVNRALAAEYEESVPEMAQTAMRYLAKQPVVSSVRTAEEVTSGTDATAALFQHSFHPVRGGDFYVELKPTCLISSYDAGTTHGTPHMYDRAVPIVFYGPGIRAGHSAVDARTVDIGPTLATYLGMALPPELDGHALPLR